MIENKNMKYLDTCVNNQQNQIAKMIDFVMKSQLLDRKMWQRFVDVFIDKADNEDKYWRGEYWGKTMRGACLVYQYNHSQELYDVLKTAVINLIATQDELGRISTYKVENEFQSWDIWCRKYVLTGMLHFYDICSDEILKNQIINSMRKHVDYLISKIGSNKGQIKITETSEWWLGVNSSSILEAIIDFYKKTGDQKYFDFATYIVNEGGIKEGNLIDIVKSREYRPDEYPEKKAYETMSFFEGIYEYSKITHNKDLKDTALLFFEDVDKYEISIIGNAGTNEECFSDTVINQLTKQEKFMQETCVVVTWMRILAKLFLDTGNIKYYEKFIRGGLNSFYGSLNYNQQNGWAYYAKKVIEPLPFDSYSPLLYNRRGISTGGLNFFKDGTSYGCCACIGSAGAGLLANLSLTEDDNYIYINEYFNCKASNKDYLIKITGDYFSNGRVVIELQSQKAVKIRIPQWSKTTIINNKEVRETGYYLLEDRGLITIQFGINIEVHHLQDYVALTYGDITLGLDNESNPDIDFANIEYSNINNIHPSNNSLGDFVTLEGELNNNKVIMKDYASCGKHWNDKNLILTAWIKE